MLNATIFDLIGQYGYGAVGLAIGLESAGIPLPGEATLVAAALYAGTTHRLDIGALLLTATAAAIVGDNLGFLIGRSCGAPLLTKYGGRLGLTVSRIKLGRYLFDRYGAAVVFFGRFVAVLRTWAAILAGANRMTWPRFLVANGLGGLLWAGLYTLVPYAFGERIALLSRPLGVILLGLALLTGIIVIVALRRHAGALTVAAEHAYPGPLLP